MFPLPIGKERCNKRRSLQIFHIVMKKRNFSEFTPIVTLFLRLAGMTVLYSFLRLIFYLLNHTYFASVDSIVFLYGLRFDIVALCYLNALYALMILLPSNHIFKKSYRAATDVVFALPNAIGLTVACIDLAYFPYSLRRATLSLFNFVEATNNMSSLIPQFLHDYWIAVCVFITSMALMCLLMKFVNYSLSCSFQYNEKRHLAHLGSSRLVIILLMLVGCRGGLQLRPINVVSAGLYTSVENMPLVLNTPFTMIHSIGKSDIKMVKYFEDEAEMTSYFSPLQSASPNNLTAIPEFDNVVVIILEGISSEFSDYLAEGPKVSAGFTPFIDSIARRSVVFHGRANGQQSIVSVSAILGGIPTLSEQPFTQSHYATNRIRYPMSVIKKKGMHTMFFHGGANGTMGFDKFCELMGMDDYYGLDEYPNQEEDHDGHWGIFDEPYLQYVAQMLNQEKNPFFACIYTLSSHHPFTVPAQYANILPKGDFPMLQTVAYTDMALRKFFATIANEPWYEKTLFVITSDHTDFAESPHNHNGELYHVPMIFHHPGNRHPLHSSAIVQQTDIMPSILSLMDNQEPFTAFGTNAFDTTRYRFAISYKEPYYQMETAAGKYDFDARNDWQYSTDSLAHNIQERNLMKAIIQQYNNRMVTNRLY